MTRSVLFGSLAPSTTHDLCRGAVADELQYVTDAEGNLTAVLVPIDLWREISSERETAHLLRSPAMRERLLAARARIGGTALSDVLAGLEIERPEAGHEKLR